MTDQTPPLPDAGELVARVRAALAEGGQESATRVLDACGPAVDELVDAAAIAAWLGIAKESIYRERSRKRADGAPAWPEPDKSFGRSHGWTYRTIALYRASMPGQGSAGRGRPRKRVDAD